MSQKRVQPAITRVEITNFRGLKALTIAAPSLLNVIVGKNAAGKTSILEAIHLACSGNEPHEFMQLNMQRGLHAFGSTLSAEAFFTNFNISQAAVCKLGIGQAEQGHALSFEMQWKKSSSLPQVFAQLDAAGNIISTNTASEKSELGTLQLNYSYSNQSVESPQVRTIDVVFSGNNITTNVQGNAGMAYPLESKFLPWRTQNSIDPARIYSQLSRAGNKEAFDTLIQLVDSRIESLSITAETQPPSLEAKFKGEDKLIPAALLGDGLQRAMLYASYLFIPNLRVLCIDEIDVGLHRDTLKDLWKAIYKTCCERNIQLFCTTHDEKIISSLIEAIRECDGNLDDFSVHLLHRKKDGSLLIQTRNAEYVDGLQSANFDIMM